MNRNKMSVAVLGAEPNPLFGHVVHYREGLLLRVPEDVNGRLVPCGREA